jgi:hypothetical protein
MWVPATLQCEGRYHARLAGGSTVNSHLITPLLITALVLWGVYRRVRRTFGRQRVNPGRLKVVVGLMAVLGALMLAALWHDSTLLLMLLAGVIGGAVLSQLGLRYTNFEATPQGRFYTPHAYIGLVVLALFFGRLVYQFLLVHGQGTAPPAHADPLALYRRNPLTLAVFGLLIGYYVLYNLGVLTRTRELADAPTMGPTA